ncbi:Transcriptional adapter 3 [Exaiptasia diaphana]|nr:Transcriptional adapter 3 [Exaiptasia diaphana]
MAGEESNNEKDSCPLQYCEFDLVDHAQLCPFYTSLLTRSVDESIALEELDLLTSDLETLLAACNRRMRLLEGETKVLVDWAEKKDKKMVRQKELEILNSLTYKRSKAITADDSRGSKKQKLDDSKTSSQGRKKGLGKEVGVDDDTYSLTSKSKADAPNRFWAAVEPYCSDLTLEDAKFLEDSIKSADNEEEWSKIPTLGKHYSEKWAQEDLIEEQLEGIKLNEKRRGALSNSSENNKSEQVSAILKKTENSSLQTEEDSCPFGPLTQRLVSALIEENIIAPMDQSILANMKSGLIDEDHGEEEDDEVLSELKKHQTELKTLVSKNKQAKQDLLKLVQDEMRRQELRHRCRLVDAEIMENFRKISACKQKRKSPTKKEKEAAWKALREREAIYRVLDNN